jgi:hypothetical protein
VTYYCPPGSTSPTVVGGGSYTTPEDAPLTLRSGSVVCEAGRYCVDGQRSLCPAGTYGDVTALADPTCSGPCAEGYYCPAGSSSATAQPCGGVAFYCPLGSAAPLPVAAGSYSAPETALPTLRTGSTVCEAGRYCDAGQRILCPAGLFGLATGQSSKGLACNRKCGLGRFSSPSLTGQTTEPDACPNPCPLGRFGAKTGASSVTGACALCPAGTYGLRPGQASQAAACSPCPAGTFGSVPGLVSVLCSGLCAAGAFSGSGSVTCTQCPAGTTSIPGALGCIPAVCPPGQGPSGTTTSACIPCAAGQFSTGTAACAPCPANTFSGPEASTCTACPDGEVSDASRSMCRPISDCSGVDSDGDGYVQKKSLLIACRAESGCHC